jgi:hypothetical protein
MFSILYLNRSGIDPEKQTATVLSPSPEKLPSSILLLMDMQFMDIDIWYTGQMWYHLIAGSLKPQSMSRHVYTLKTHYPNSEPTNPCAISLLLYAIKRTDLIPTDGRYWLIWYHMLDLVDIDIWMDKYDITNTK